LGLAVAGAILLAAGCGGRKENPQVYFDKAKKAIDQTRTELASKNFEEARKAAKSAKSNAQRVETCSEPGSPLRKSAEKMSEEAAVLLSEIDKAEGEARTEAAAKAKEKGAAKTAEGKTPATAAPAAEPKKDSGLVNIDPTAVAARSQTAATPAPGGEGETAQGDLAADKPEASVKKTFGPETPEICYGRIVTKGDAVLCYFSIYNKRVPTATILSIFVDFVNANGKKLFTVRNSYYAQKFSYEGGEPSGDRFTPEGIHLPNGRWVEMVAVWKPEKPGDVGGAEIEVSMAEDRNPFKGQVRR